LFKKRLSTPRAATVIVLAAVVALSVTVAPSIAGSFLTPQAASQKFVTKQKASKTYLTKAGASNYLSKKAAANTYLPKKGAPLQPAVAIAASNTLYSVNQSGSGYIPTAFVSFATKANVSDAVITFSGNASCSLPGKAPTVAQSCPITVLVDGQPAASKVGFAPATSEGTTKEPVASLNHTVMLTTVLGKGGHTIAIQYAGAAFLSFQLKSFNLAVQTYPQAEEEEETTTTSPSGKSS
jgi:phosphoribosylcarboxyaminoimidazole (NCAIR) mutase